MVSKSSVPEDWKVVPFHEVIDFQEGPGIMAKDFRPTGIPLIRLSGLQDGASVTNGCNFLDPTMVSARWNHFRLKLGDILLSTSASLGRTAVVGSDGVGAVPYTGIIRMRAKDDRVHNPFIRFLLQAPMFQRQVEASGVGSVIRHFGPSHLRGMTLVIPPVDQQRAIAQILGTLDDKIELNRKMNATLDEIARALFTSWFVDFDPVRAKAEGRRPEGMDAETAALFPDRFVDSELGPIPEGWEWSTIGDEFNVVMGQSPPGSTYNQAGHGMPFYQGRTDFGFRFPSVRVYCSAPTRTARTGDTLLSVRAPVGDTNIARNDCAIGRGVAALRHHSGSESWTFHLLRSISDQLEQFNDEGTVFGAINQRDLKMLSVVAPTLSAITAFDAAIRALDDLVRSNELEHGLLAAIRDRLLPELLSGRLRMLDAECLTCESATKC